MIFKVRAVVSALVAMCIAAVAAAQGVPSAPYLTVEQRCTFLLKDLRRAVEIGLSIDQQGHVRDASNLHAKTQMHLLSAKDPDEHKLIQCDRDYADKVLAILNAEQEKRLLQLGLPQIGISALGDDHFAARLKLSDAQQAKVTKLLEVMSNRNADFGEMVAKGLEDIPRPKKPEQRAEYEKKRAAVMRSYDAERKHLSADQAATTDKILAVLTPAQLAQWKALSGN